MKWLENQLFMNYERKADPSMFCVMIRLIRLAFSKEANAV